ncbi:MAG: hypothetical protein GX890_08810 [Firmicutes bacterium]|nr:hypothetical protein [Bacillota bacterium]HPU01618.1 stage II sporulation protein P [Bacillota bacterium]
MYGKANSWKARRRKKRSRREAFFRSGRRQRQAKYPLLARQRKAFAAALLLLLLLLLYSSLLRSPAAEPPRQPGGPAGEEAAESPLVHFLQRLLGHEIPGLEPPAASYGDEIYAALCRAMRSLTGIDPSDPSSVLDLELGLGKGVSMPALIPPSSAAPGGKEPEPSSPGFPSPPPWGESAYPFPLPGYGEAPILLYHTHASESYRAVSGKAAPAGRSVVAVGEELARLLEEKYGLQVLHHRGVYDVPRRFAYSKARPEIEKILAENSGIQLVIDLHRDGVARAKTTAILGGKEMAAILLVHGTGNPHAEKNLEFVMRLQYELEAVAPGLSRGILQQDFVYNQDLHPYAILVEVGGHENSVDEALLSLPYLAEAIARTYYLFFMQD